MKHIHILGICGTFMAGLALIAKEMGMQVSGADQNIYPPMSDVLKNAGIEIFEGWDKKQFSKKIDCVIVGNAMSRGNEAIEYILNENIPYASGPQWLYENVLKGRHVIAIAGTHGKTLTTALITWILENAKLQPGFLIGGVPKNFKTSAQLGKKPFFVIEGDEYDTAFFDKGSKFLRYHPKTLILNNLEFDHIDIFKNIDAIKKQFKNLIKIIPGNGKIIYSDGDKHLKSILKKVWTPVESTGLKSGQWRAHHIQNNGLQFDVYFRNKLFTKIHWNQCGYHQVQNALNAIAAAHTIGISKKTIVQAFQTFEGVKRRMEIRGIANNVTVYDDFAHHPTAIAANVNALRESIKPHRLIAVLQCGTNTLKSGFYDVEIIEALQKANYAFILSGKKNYDSLHCKKITSKTPLEVFSKIEALLKRLLKIIQPHDHVLIMSNTSFDGLHKKLLEKCGAHLK